jgi:hypothetical protein
MRKIIGWGIVALILLVGLGYLGVIWLEYKSRPIVHLVPEGTKGWCYVLWDDPNASPLIETKSERILQFNEKGIARSSYSPDGGYYIGYYYVDKNGKRTEIPGFTDLKPDPEASIFKYEGGSYWIDQNGSMYPAVDLFFLGTRTEIKTELARINREEQNGFPSFPEEVQNFLERYEK